MMKSGSDKSPSSRTSFRDSAKNARRPPPNYFSRREQVRLLLLCSTLMLVLVMMNEARKPTNWDWLWAGERPTTPSAPEKPIDTLIANDDLALPADGFTTPPGQDTPGVDDKIAYLPEITPELLTSIKDNTVMRSAENEAWLTMFVALRSRSAEQIEAASLGKVGFAQLYRQTDFYRGQMVTVSGSVRRLEAIKPRENNYGITQLYRWILRPHGGDAPIVVYSLEKPNELEVSNDLREPCSFTGLCFKRWAYPAGDGTRVAPLLLAKAPTWKPATQTANTPLPSKFAVVGSVFGLLCLSSAIAFVVYRTANVQRPEIDRLRLADSELEERLHNEEVLPGTSEALRAMGQSHDGAAS